MAPSVGRIVHYRVPEHDAELRHNNVEAGELLPAIIVRVWNPTMVQLQVFVDGPCGSKWRTSVAHGDGPGQWHWPVKS